MKTKTILTFAVPMLYIGMEIMFQRQLMQTLHAVTPDSIRIMEYVSRGLMTMSVVLALSYAYDIVAYRKTTLLLAVMVFVASGFTFDVVNKMLPSASRTAIIYNFMAHRDALSSRDQLQTTLRLAVDNQIGHDMKVKVLSGANQMMATMQATKMQAYRTLHKQGRHVAADLMVSNVFSMYKTFNKPKYKKTINALNNSIEQQLGFQLADEDKPFPNILKAYDDAYRNHDFQHEEALQEACAEWLKKVLLKHANMTERDALQVSIMIPLGFIISTIGIIINLALLMVRIIKTTIKMPEFDAVYQWVILSTVGVVCVGLALNGIVATTLAVSNITLM